jgi:NO-binding membrane sensor protein with MHYT domain
MAFPIVLAWISSTFAADTKSGVGIGIVIAVTHAVGVAASNIYPSNEAPQFLSGNIITGSLGLAAAVGAVAMSTILHLENRRRDRKYGRPETAISLVMTGEADKHKDFRYVL